VEAPPPVTLDSSDLAGALAATWALDAGEIQYVPKGGGSYHWIVALGGIRTCFVTVDDLDTKPWIGARRDAVFEGLRTAYETAWVLRHEAGLAFVVGPLRAADGTVIVRLSDQYSMAVFPFVAGRAGRWGGPLTGPGRDALLRDLATLHQARLPASIRLARRPLGLPERPALLAALDEVGRPWEGGPLSEPARHALASHARSVTGRLEQLDALARQLGAAEDGLVLTHGEPHPGNLIRAAGGLRLIDWDTVALARPERDLWMLDDGSPGGLARYEELTGTAVSDAAITFYRLAWTLSDIASVADLFRRPHQPTDWVRRQWGAFQRLLAGAASAPYGEPGAADQLPGCARFVGPGRSQLVAGAPPDPGSWRVPAGCSIGGICGASAAGEASQEVTPADRSRLGRGRSRRLRAGTGRGGPGSARQQLQQALPVGRGRGRRPDVAEALDLLPDPGPGQDLLGQRHAGDRLDQAPEQARIKRRHHEEPADEAVGRRRADAVPRGAHLG
jgi:spectinomycin phosphotransferase